MLRTLSKSGLVLAALFALQSLPAYSQTTIETVKQRLLLQARLSSQTPVLTEGVEWRIFGSVPRANGDLPELGIADGGSTAFDIKPGEYIVHASFGYASAVKKIEIGAEALAEDFILNAGGLKLSASSTNNTSIPQSMIKFDVYEQETSDDGERRLLAQNVNAGAIVAFPAGTYHVVSRFGELNASVRADLHVQPGKLTEANLQHRAAIISFRLVRVKGGDAIPDTAWSILTENGEVVRETVSTFPSMVLAEGAYSAIVKHNERIYSEDFRVRPGFHKDVEVLLPN